MIKKHNLIFILFIYGINCFSQIVYEKGYYINNSEQKVECLIKNIDWADNPTEFEFKLSENETINNFKINDVSEFGVYGVSKFIRSKVKIDKKNYEMSNLDYEKNPTFTEEVLLLKVLVEGKHNLYIYESGNLVRFFYNNNGKIEQLIYKKYLFSDTSTIENNEFKHQLLAVSNCTIIESNVYENINYNRSSLVDFFIKLNRCENSEVINFESKTSKIILNITARPRFNNNSFSMNNGYYSYEFENKVNFGFGIDFEFILPFNKKKWSISVEPTYQKYSSEIVNDASHASGGSLKVNLDYNSIELPFSLRHYFFLNKQSKLFANISYIVDINSKSKIEFKRADGSVYDTLEIDTSNNFALGIGCKYRNKYSFEFRVQTSRELLANYVYWNDGYKTMSLIFGYTLF